jgi:type 1 glutamine amidotransferase
MASLPVRCAWLVALALALAGCVRHGAPAAASVQPPPAAAQAKPTRPARILVFTRTTGFRHDSIPAAVALLRELAKASGLEVEHSEDAGVFDDDMPQRYRAVVFANTTGNILDAAQRRAFERFVRGGGGFLGLHSAADSEYTSDWYRELIVARFESHPPGLQSARVHFEGVADVDQAPWRVTDELYNYDHNPRGTATVLATVTEADYDGGRMGADHPIAWCHDRHGGRAWYTGLGHDIPLYGDATYRRHLLRGLRYAAGLADAC